MPAPPFGTASAYTDSFPAPPPRQVTVSAETCFNLNSFKDMVRQYRRLDDQIITRLNRAQAQLRDQSRIAKAGPSLSSASALGGVDGAIGIEGMCLNMWHEMMAGWAHRQTLLSYCLETVTSSLEAKKPGNIHDERLAGSPSSSSTSSGARYRERGWREEEVLANQLGNEESIEAIIRKRSLDAFKSRCPFFALPKDEAGRGWWDLADSGRAGQGPEIITA